MGQEGHSYDYYTQFPWNLYEVPTTNDYENIQFVKHTKYTYKI